MNSKKQYIEEELQTYGIVPVIKIKDISASCELAEVLNKAGLPIAEITFRAKDAEKAIKQIKTNYPGMLVLAGTVQYEEQIEKAISAGADIIVTPGFNERIVNYCVDHNIPIVPGCVTPSEIEKVMTLGINILKFFPAENMGGVETIKALKGPYETIKFVPTGGISLSNLSEYLSLSNVLACGGSFLVPEDLLQKRDWTSIFEICKRTKEIVASVRRNNNG